jgi:cytochrome c556
MNSARIAIAGALLVSGYALYAKPVARPAAPTAQELVAVRQAGMALSANTLGAISAGVANGAAAKGAGFPAKALANWAKAMPALFAPGTKGVASEARPEVWSDAPGFAAKAKAFQDATDALVAASQADDKAALSAALASTKAACKGCHDSYKVAPPPKPS